MKLAIFGSGNIIHGNYSSCGGEGRLGLNYLNAFSKYIPGVEIDFYGSIAGYIDPQWGAAPQLENVRMLSELKIQGNVNYDASICTPWHTRLPRTKFKRHDLCDKLMNYLKADVVLHNVFSWTTGFRDFPCDKMGHVLAYPFAEGANTFPEGPDEFKSEFLPQCYGWEVQKPDPSRREIIWSVKDAFHPAWAERSHYIAESAYETLKALVRFCKKYPGRFDRVHFITGSTNFDPNWTPFVEKFNLHALLNELPEVVLYPIIRYDQIYHLLERSKFNICAGGLMGSITDSMSSATLPLVHRGHPMEPPAKEAGVLLDAQALNEDQVFDVLDMFHQDDYLYTKTMCEYQDFMNDHTMENTTKRFLDILERNS